MLTITQSNNERLLFLFRTKHRYFMDTIPPATEVSQDTARESLIAISESSPDDSVSVSELLPDDSNNVNEVGSEESDRAEDCRAKLISISYTQSPDGKKTTPVSPENLSD